MGVTTARLQPEIENPLENLSKKPDRSKNHLINQAIKEFSEAMSKMPDVEADPEDKL